MNILIVDDCRAMRMIVLRALVGAGFRGFTFQEASTGVEALRIIREKSPDLVISDWNMPGMDGLELLKTIKARGIPVKFGFITTEESPKTRREAEEAGALFIIPKPFSADCLASSLGPHFQ